MNLKERGITVGDLLLFISILLIIFTVVKKSNQKQNKAEVYLSQSEYQFITVKNRFFI